MNREIELQNVTAEDAVWVLLKHIGEDPEREGLADTPARVAKAWAVIGKGYRSYPALHLDTVFSEPGSDQMIVVKDIDFVSYCEHHMVPFVGKVHIGYIPSVAKVVGLSKFARLVDGYASRLQTQERLTQLIAKAIQAKLNPVGVGVVLKAEHSCMKTRGVKKSGVSTITTSLHGTMKTEASCRAEFLQMIN